jgi:hypothetical protein
MMNSTSKRIIPFLALAGVIVAVGFILYQAGFRVTTATSPTGQQQAPPPGQPGQHLRRQALAEGQAGQTGTQESAGGGGQGGRRGGHRGDKRPAEIRTGTLGAEKIAVIGKGKERSFTGADLEKLQQTTIASSRGARAGWRLADVLNHLTIAQGNEVVLTSQDGKTLSLPWEKVASHEPTLLLFYNSFGGLMLLSGNEVTPEEAKNLDNQGVKTLTKQNRAESTHLSQITRIEVKG